MVYVGMDVHKGQWTICVLDHNGKELYTKQVWGSWKECIRFVSKIEGTKTVTFEASCGMGWLYDRLSEVCDKVVVADPAKFVAGYVTKRKNDKIDARKLARLLFMGFIPEVYVAGKETRTWRALIEYRRHKLEARTAVKGSIRAALRTHGRQGPKGLWGRGGRKWLSEL